jgi:hypothetical protein
VPFLDVLQTTVMVVVCCRFRPSEIALVRSSKVGRRRPYAAENPWSNRFERPTSSRRHHSFFTTFYTLLHDFDAGE